MSSRPPPDLSKYPILSREQAGHIRHIHNLSSLPPGHWSDHMFTDEYFTGQEFVDAFRYQIATMTYAVSVAHYHRLPALRSVFKQLVRKLIAQMLRKEVWGYWFNTSMSGKLIDPDIKELRKPWPNPVERENIMYSGHLLLMTSLYGMLFNDDEFEQEDSIVFRWDPIFWGMGPETFKYSNRTLQKTILDEMEREGWVGVCCEPNMIFVICNQFPIIAMRYNDVRDGTDRVTEVLKLYVEAWEKRGGWAAETGFVRDSWMSRQQRPLNATEWAFSAWTNAFMHAWNPDYVENIWPKQALGSLVKAQDTDQKTQSEGQYIMNPPEVAKEYRELAQEESNDNQAASIQERAMAQAKAKLKDVTSPSYKKPMFGYAVQFLSEVPGDSARDALTSLLSYADKSLDPTWEKGGLFYPRNSTAFDEEMNWKFVSPYDGNGAIAYSRLNVVNGQKIMWDHPWTSDMLNKRPYFDDIGLDGGLDFLRGTYDEGEKLLIVSMKSWDGSSVAAKLTAKNLTAGMWELWVDGHLLETREVGESGTLTIEQAVADETVDIVLRSV